eukprot:gene6122-2728_t
MPRASAPYLQPHPENEPTHYPHRISDSGGRQLGGAPGGLASKPRRKTISDPQDSHQQMAPKPALLHTGSVDWSKTSAWQNPPPHHMGGVQPRSQQYSLPQQFYGGPSPHWNGGGAAPPGVGPMAGGTNGNGNNPYQGGPMAGGANGNGNNLYPGGPMAGGANGNGNGNNLYPGGPMAGGANGNGNANGNANNPYLRLPMSQLTAGWAAQSHEGIGHGALSGFADVWSQRQQPKPPAEPPAAPKPAASGFEGMSLAQVLASAPKRQNPYPPGPRAMADQYQGQTSTSNESAAQTTVIAVSSYGSAPAAAPSTGAADFTESALAKVLAPCGGVVDVKHTRLLENVLNGEQREGMRRLLLEVMKRSSNDVKLAIVRGSGLKRIETWVSEAVEGLGKGAPDPSEESGADAAGQAAGSKNLVMCTIECLASLPMEIDSLKRTGIGRTIGLLRKQQSAEISTASKQLIDKWKRMVDGADTQQGSQAAEKLRPKGREKLELAGSSAMYTNHKAGKQREAGASRQQCHCRLESREKPELAGSSAKRQRMGAKQESREKPELAGSSAKRQHMGAKQESREKPELAGSSAKRQRMGATPLKAIDDDDMLQDARTDTSAPKRIHRFSSAEIMRYGSTDLSSSHGTSPTVTPPPSCADGDIPAGHAPSTTTTAPAATTPHEAGGAGGTALPSSSAPHDGPSYLNRGHGSHGLSHPGGSAQGISSSELITPSSAPPPASLTISSLNAPNSTGLSPLASTLEASATPATSSATSPAASLGAAPPSSVSAPSAPGLSVPPTPDGATATGPASTSQTGSRNGGPGDKGAQGAAGPSSSLQPSGGLTNGINRPGRLGSLRDGHTGLPGPPLGADTSSTAPPTAAEPFHLGGSSFGVPVQHGGPAAVRAAAAKARHPSPEAEPDIKAPKPKSKSVTWVPDDQLVRLRWFRKDDPCAAAREDVSSNTDGDVTVSNPYGLPAGLQGSTAPSYGHNEPGGRQYSSQQLHQQQQQHQIFESDARREHELERLALAEQHEKEEAERAVLQQQQQHQIFESDARREHELERLALAEQHEKEEAERAVLQDRLRSLAPSLLWTTPPLAVQDHLTASWKVCYGEASEQVFAMEQRALRLPAVQYPTPAHVPPSPSGPPASEAQPEPHNVTPIPVIPLNIPAAAMAAVAAVIPLPHQLLSGAPVEGGDPLPSTLPPPTEALPTAYDASPMQQPGHMPTLSTGQESSTGGVQIAGGLDLPALLSQLAPALSSINNPGAGGGPGQVGDQQGTNPSAPLDFTDQIGLLLQQLQRGAAPQGGPAQGGQGGPPPPLGGGQFGPAPPSSMGDPMGHQGGPPYGHHQNQPSSGQYPRDQGGPWGMRDQGPPGPHHSRDYPPGPSGPSAHAPPWRGDRDRDRDREREPRERDRDRDRELRDRDRDRPAPGRFSSGRGPPFARGAGGPTSNKLCMFFNAPQGCNNGENCRFLHARTGGDNWGGRPASEEMDDTCSVTCDSGENCLFVHARTGSDNWGGRPASEEMNDTCSVICNSGENCCFLHARTGSDNWGGRPASDKMDDVHLLRNLQHQGHLLLPARSHGGRQLGWQTCLRRDGRCAGPKEFWE